MGRPPAAAVSDDLLESPSRPPARRRVLSSASRRRAARGLEAKSTPTDLVSAADREAERAVLEVLGRRRPDDGILGEEGADVEGTTGLRWIVDPLDGTINYLLGLDEWSVSVACENRVGVVLHPPRDELFSVVAGGDARAGGARLRPSRRRPRDRRRRHRLRLRRGRAGATGGDRGARASRGRPTSAASGARRSTSRGRRPAASTRSTSTAGRRGTSRPARMLCTAAGLEVHDLPARDGLPPGTLVAPPAFADELLGIVR